MCVDLGYEVPNKIITEGKVVEKVENVFCKPKFGVGNELSKIYIYYYNSFQTNVMNV